MGDIAMSENDLARVKSDLDVMEHSLGLAHAWDPREYTISLLFAGAGIAAAVWASFAVETSTLLGLGLLVVPVVAWLRAAARASDDPSVWRDVQAAVRAAWLVFPLVALWFWCRAVGLTELDFLGLSTFLIGAVLFSAAMADWKNLAMVGWAIPLMAAGLLVSVYVEFVVVLLAGAIGLGGLLSATISRLARKKAQCHAAD
jgi:hypothetical protein